MSLGKRLYDVARAELRHQTRRFGARRPPGDVDLNEPAGPPTEAEVRAGEQEANEEPSPYPPNVQRYYANLELPVGAPLEEVKAAYKRLMKRYHPDLHQQDPERAAAATKLSQALRTAYEGLLAYLAPR